MGQDWTDKIGDWGQKMQDEGSWQAIRGRIREQWGEVSDQDLEESRGNWDQLVGKIKEKTGASTEEVESKLKQMS